MAMPLVAADRVIRTKVHLPRRLLPLRITITPISHLLTRVLIHRVSPLFGPLLLRWRVNDGQAGARDCFNDWEERGPQTRVLILLCEFLLPGSLLMSVCVAVLTVVCAPDK